MATIGKLVVSLEANSAKLVKALGKSRKRLKAWGGTVLKITKRAAAAFKAVAIGAGVAGAGILALALNTTRQITTMATMAKSFGISTDAMQKWAIAGKEVGLEGDKIGDIFKDVSDKLGDFILTGGGGAADLFENMNIKIEDFIGLAPDQAVLKLGAAMDGLNKQDKIFFLEAIASDASLLLPLIENNGEAFKRLATEAENAGVILSSTAVAGVVAFNSSMNKTKTFIGGIVDQMTAALAPALEFVNDEMFKYIRSIGDAKDIGKFFAKAFIQGLVSILNGLSEMLGVLDRMELKFAELKISWLEFNYPIDLKFQTSDASERLRVLQSEANQLRTTLAGGNKFREKVTAFADEIESKIDANVTTTIASTGVDGLTKGNNEAAQSSRNLAAELNKVTQSPLWKELFDKPEVTARSAEFDKVAQRVKEGIENGSKFTADSIKHLGDILKAAQNNSTVFSNNGKFEQVDIKGMAEVVAGLSALALQGQADSGQSDAIKLAAEKMAQSGGQVASNVVQFVSKANQQPSLGKLNFTFQTDTGKVAGEIFAEPKFVSQLQEAIDTSTNNAARADVN